MPTESRATMRVGGEVMPRPGLPVRAILLTASCGCAMTVLDTNIVAIVLPAIAHDLGARFADVEWVISTYVLCFASLLLPAGAIADRYGRRRVFLAGIAVFAIASLWCGVSSTAAMLSVARALQGVGAAFLLAPALAIIGHTFHDEGERAKAWAIWGGMMGLTMVLAPILGGAIAFLLGWRWAFFVNLPICLVLAAAVVWFIEESRDAAARALDPAGIVFFAAAMFGITWGLINGQAHGWSSAPALTGFGGGVASLGVFLAVEARQPRPMLDLSLFRVPRFIGAVLAMFSYAAASQVMASLLPLYLQNGLGRAPLEAGFAMLPFALAMLIMPQAGRWLGRFLTSPQLLVLGLAIVSLGDLMIGLAARGQHGPAVLVGMLVLGSGGGLMNGETQKGIMGSVARDRAGMASGISTTARFSGILMGFATLSAIVAVVGRSSLLAGACATAAALCDRSRIFAEAVIAGDVPLAISGLPPDTRQAALDLAHTGYAAGFSAAVITASGIALASAVLVAFLMRPTPALNETAAAPAANQ
ncbi:MFS transporter [Lichenihabitans sp. PAMC28606]|uniref:MFS transporter n=1 Tax=Lichenihabitans sp. PAMC28606 TaxID=2880932 RepID=UPI001D0A55EB|nr:MFS transporter [Lichenihabitans sp. PAMC28606]UDL93262.1 MFS transporter [Lichenihabitans sp. PAMC28606]